MSDPVVVTRVRVRGNYISGAHAYNNAIDIQSASHVDVTGNVIENITGSASADFVTHIRAEYRATAGVASRALTIRGNAMTANPSTAKPQIGIYVDNGAGATVSANGLIISDNQLLSPDVANAFTLGIGVHGQTGGWNHIVVSSNYVEGIPTSASPMIGLISVVAVKDAVLVGNTLQCHGGSGNLLRGICVGPAVDRATLGSNTITDCHFGIQTQAGVTNFYLSDDNIISGTLTGGSDLDFTSSPLRAHLFATATPSWSAGVVLSLGYVKADVVVRTANVGDSVAVGCSPALLDGVIVSGAVTSSNVVTVTLFNARPSSLTNLPTVLNVDVWKL
jgi:hypothetical protein